MRSAIIVGAGIGGLAAAIAVRRAGWSVRVVEQAETPRELGFALALAPYAMDALGELGLGEVVAARGVAVNTFEVRRPDGRVLKRVDLRHKAVHAVFVLRPALHGVLLDAVGGEALTLGQRVDTVTSGEDAAVVLADGRRISGDVVIGADGAGSAIRRALHPSEAPPSPSGYHALRGVSHDVADRLGAADSVVYLGDGVEIGFARASASAVYWYISLLDDLAALAPAELLERCLRGFDGQAAAIARAAAPEDIRADRLFVRAPMAQWGAGRVTLLGDAAHPVLPHTGQGAALALEDAVAIGLALRRPDVEAGLRAYEQVRAERTRPIVRSGPRIAAMTTTRSRARIALRDTLVRLTPASAIGGMLGRPARDPHVPLRG